jgi:hypothetical protein
VGGRITLDGQGVATFLRLGYLGCEHGGSECGAGTLFWVVAETTSEADGTYVMRGRVPEDYCGGGLAEDKVRVTLHGDLAPLLRESAPYEGVPACGENVAVDFAFTCQADVENPELVPECAGTLQRVEHPAP